MVVFIKSSIAIKSFNFLVDINTELYLSIFRSLATMTSPSTSNISKRPEYAGVLPKDFLYGYAYAPLKLQANH